MSTTRQLIHDLPLKEADPSLLTLYILGWADGDKRVLAALEFAAFFHRSQTRSNRGNLPRDNYITHPLRNAARLIKYDVIDRNIIIAAILHDTVEDCAAEISRSLVGTEPLDDEHAQGVALHYIDFNFGSEVAGIVEEVTNRPHRPGLSKAEKIDAYLNHVEHAITDADSFLVKFVDWVDNGAGLHHNVSPSNAGMISHLSHKYSRLAALLRKRIETEPGSIQDLVSDEGWTALLSHLDSGEKSLAKLTSAN